MKENNWKDEWKNMPEYNNIKEPPPYRINNYGMVLYDKI